MHEGPCSSMPRPVSVYIYLPGRGVHRGHSEAEALIVQCCLYLSSFVSL